MSTLLETEHPSAELRSTHAGEADRAWRALYDEQFARVYRLVARFGVASADVEDVTQQVFLVAYRRLREVDDVRCVPGWLRGIAARVTSEYHRWWRVRRVKAWLVEVTESGRTPAVTPERATEAAQLQQRVTAVLQRMSPKLRAVLVLCDIEECELGEAAEALGVPSNTVRSRRRLARLAFQELWEQREGGLR